MSLIQTDAAPALISAIERHLPAGVQPDSPGRNMSSIWATYIIRTRALGSYAFHQTESRAQIADLLPAIRDLRQVVGRIGPLDRSFVDASLGLYLLSQQGGGRSEPCLAELEGLLDLIEKVILWRQRLMQGSGHRRLAHRSVDWPRMATAQACCIVWAYNAMTLQTSEWREHVKGAPKDPSGEQEIEPSALGELLLSFAPRTIHRDLPSAFGRFLQDVLKVFSDVGTDAGGPNAADTLKALRRVQDRMKPALP